MPAEQLSFGPIRAFNVLVIHCTRQIVLLQTMFYFKAYKKRKEESVQTWIFFLS